MKNKKEIKKLLDQVNSLYYPTKYKFQLVVNSQIPESDNSDDIIVRFHVNAKNEKI